jgi:uncharacterized protein (DUF433 family)
MIDWRLYIQSNPSILYGKPVIMHTRISVDLILEKLAAGDSVQEIIMSYPSLTNEAITACLLFAADSIKNEIIHAKAS